MQRQRRLILAQVGRAKAEEARRHAMNHYCVPFPPGPPYIYPNRGRREPHRHPCVSCVFFSSSHTFFSLHGCSVNVRVSHRFSSTFLLLNVCSSNGARGVCVVRKLRKCPSPLAGEQKQKQTGQEDRVSVTRRSGFTCVVVGPRQMVTPDDRFFVVPHYYYRYYYHYWRDISVYMTISVVTVA